MVEWEVRGTEHFRDWFEGLDSDQQDAIVARIQLLRASGPNLGRPVVDSIAGSSLHNLKELRASKGGALRVLFIFDPLRQAVLLIGGDKTNHWEEWYRWAIPEAERIYQAYLDELGEEGK